MDQAVIQYYRRLLKEDFPNAGALDNASVFVEAIGEKLINCGNTGNYMQLYLKVADRRITEIKYLCACEPVANVAVEILCVLMKGKMLDEVADMTEDPFFQFLESRDVELRKKIQGLLELLNEGIEGYSTMTDEQGSVVIDRDDQVSQISWDGTLST